MSMVNIAKVIIKSYWQLQLEWIKLFSIEKMHWKLSCIIFDVVVSVKTDLHPQWIKIGQNTNSNKFFGKIFMRICHESNVSSGYQMN